LLDRRWQKARSLANRRGIPIAGKLEIILTYWRIGAPISYTASLFANIDDDVYRPTTPDLVDYGENDDAD
jgi:hypothetical protein